MCGVCGEEGYSAEICAKVVIFFACEADPSDSDGDKNFGEEEQDAFVCDAPSKSFDEPGEEGCRALSWQMGDLPVICDNGASYHMPHSSTGMINYREANVSLRTASGKKYSIDG